MKTKKMQKFILGMVLTASSVPTYFAHANEAVPAPVDTVVRGSEQHPGSASQEPVTVGEKASTGESEVNKAPLTNGTQGLGAINWEKFVRSAKKAAAELQQNASKLIAEQTGIFENYRLVATQLTTEAREEVNQLREEIKSMQAQADTQVQAGQEQVQNNVDVAEELYKRLKDKWSTRIQGNYNKYESFFTGVKTIIQGHHAKIQQESDSNASNTEVFDYQTLFALTKDSYDRVVREATNSGSNDVGTQTAKVDLSKITYDKIKSELNKVIDANKNDVKRVRAKQLMIEIIEEAEKSDIATPEFVLGMKALNDKFFGEVEQAQRKIEDLNKKLSSKQSALENLQSKTNLKTKEALDTLNAQIADAESEVRNSQAEIAKLEEALKSERIKAQEAITSTSEDWKVVTEKLTKIYTGVSDYIINFISRQKENSNS